MENAVKALMMAAGVLIGLMIASLGVTLFSSLSQYTDNTQQKIEENALQKFNEQFTRFINCDDAPGATPEFTLTIQDIITAANIAYENNKNYGLTSADPYNYYVTVNITGISLGLEQSINTNSATLLKDNIEKKYICRYKDVQINPNTNKVCEVNFSDIT